MSRFSTFALRGGAVVAALTGALFLAGAAWGGGWAGHHGCRGQAATEAELREHLDDVSARVLSRVDASDEQVDRVDALLDEAAPALFGFRQEGQALHERALAAAERDTLDRTELESVRRDGLALADRASAQALDLFVRLGDVLTVEQRQELRAW